MVALDVPLGDILTRRSENTILVVSDDAKFNTKLISESKWNLDSIRYLLSKILNNDNYPTNPFSADKEYTPRGKCHILSVLDPWTPRSPTTHAPGSCLISTDALDF